MRWVILLLAAAVLLPTVCLLWFITKTVENVRLAARQRLADFYEQKLKEISVSLDSAVSSRVEIADEMFDANRPYGFFRQVVLEKGWDGVLLYGSEGRRIYPALNADSSLPAASEMELAEAWKLEFVQQKQEDALKAYRKKADSNDTRLQIKAIIGQSRCLAKLDKWDEAIEMCRQVTSIDPNKETKSEANELIADARLLLLKFLKRDVKNVSLFRNTFRQLAEGVYPANEPVISIPADKNFFLARRVLEVYGANKFLQEENESLMEQIGLLAEAERLSIKIAETLDGGSVPESNRRGYFHRLIAVEQPVYALSYQKGQHIVLVTARHDTVVNLLHYYKDSFTESDVVLRVSDESGRTILGPKENEGRAFVAGTVGDFFPGWKAEMYFSSGNVFEDAAHKQVAVYTWTGVLVIGLILVVGCFAGRVVGKQIRLNRLKNDFIATVSHELKTPLASMRVLVDTLLEGRYRDQQQAEEYLRLTARENERLSRLIDNFLTFSRMERNKKAFDIEQTSAAEIAEAAVEAVQTKFNNENCKFTVTIDDNLPFIMADKDAMITVLVNLLDNAYKYTCDDKLLELKVFSENGFVCFSVKDNGVGMTRRQMKKVFGRFYQADSTLARRTGGTGLGLSIVKFVVDAHKGRITIESKPDKGSEFTVKLPSV